MDPRAAISMIDFASFDSAIWNSPALLPTAIHIWQLPLIVPESLFLELASSLSPDERERAARFHFERDSRKFTVARGLMRSILAAYLGQSPRELAFSYSQYGKPSLSVSSSDIRFSISHSGDFALLAVARDRQVGVDIEKIREDVETDKLAERFFSEAEGLAIRQLAAERRVAAFFRCWTCKEAFLKAQGIGLSRPLDSFDVEVNTERPARLLATRTIAHEADKWALYDIEAPSDYAAAVAIEGSVIEITILRPKP